MKSTVLLHTERGNNFPVIEMVNDDDQLTIGLHPRVSISLFRFLDKITIDCDLGMDPGDFCRVCQIDLSKSDYQSAIVFDPEFMSRARSFENDFHIKKFVRERAKRLAVGMGLPPEHVFGNTAGISRVDQVYINLTNVFNERVNRNLEFSLYRADYMDDEPLAEPIFTLCASVRLTKKVAHWFLFATWTGSDLWSYGKHLFYNNTIFSDKLFRPAAVAV